MTEPRSTPHTRRKRKAPENLLSPSLKRQKIHEEPMPSSSRRVNTKQSDAPKKLKIQPFKVKPKVPENFETDTWNKLKNAIDAIYNKKGGQTSREELYKAVRDLCIHKKSENLFNNLKEQLQKHTGEKLNQLSSKNTDSESFLTNLKNIWEDHCEQMILIRNIFLYLDRTYVMQNSSVRSLWDMGLEFFRKYVVLEPEIEKKCINDLLQLIRQEREGEQLDRSLIKTLISMLVSLNIYVSHFEQKLINNTKEFYYDEGKRCVEQYQTSEYLIHVESRLRDENDRVTKYLDSSTRKSLISVVEEELILRHVEFIVSRGFDDLVEAQKISDLRRMYVLFSKVNRLPDIKTAFNTYIKKAGKNIVMDKERDDSMVTSLLEFKNKMDVVYQESFHKDEAYKYSIREGFEAVLNTRENKPAELIAKFIDKKLKTGHRGETEEEMEQTLEKVLNLFRFINGKDVFEAFYKKDLAKRLLLGRSASLDAEKLMIAKLKSECGSAFTAKLEGMFKDMDLSRDLNDGFKKSKEYKQQSSNIDLNVSVLTTGCWPPYTPVDIKLPPEVAELQEVFKKFYLSKHNGRKLLWQSTLGTASLLGRYPSGQRQFRVSCFQACVLMVFNESDRFSYKQIKEMTGLVDGELTRTLQSLACAKVKVLVKEPKGKDVNEDDEFVFNYKFNHKLFNIKINTIQMQETPDEQKTTHEKVFRDRQFQIDAAIVRIMKSRKTMTHTQLTTDVLALLKFPLKGSDLKKRIESLIERDYMERSEDDPSTYHYVA
eukprot:gb/GECH01014520.1/.p1 GENE.gb/GECH01014520.1/~~gb/GECH01014520.1/.p1  ORF type:complete len:769 (+),score=194.98 gb/GECH01014520.1/:1-2307(+)